MKRTTKNASICSEMMKVTLDMWYEQNMSPKKCGTIRILLIRDVMLRNAILVRNGILVYVI